MTCELCGREAIKLFKHHVRPQSEGGTNGEIRMCCHPCANQVHMLFTNKELATMTWDELRGRASVKRYVEWVKDKKGARFKLRRSSRVKRRR